MARFDEHRRSRFTPEQIAWHVFSVSIIGLMLLVLIVWVESLGDPALSIEGPPPIERATTPKGAPRDAAVRGHSAVGRPIAPIDRFVAAA